ncbi:MAG: hypothetical protein ACHQ5A_05895 [Opitutales bacterium]
MSAVSVRPLPENAGLAYVGERSWRGGALQPGQARALWTTANASGRPNSDVLRCFLGVGREGLEEHWQIDFPPFLTAPEAALYAGPFGLLEQRPGSRAPAGWWDNPYRQDSLRTAVARLERYCAAPRTWPVPHWSWIESAWLPDDTLLAVARDDDFTAGVLRSRLFIGWWQALGPPHPTALVVEAFPFPWAPGTSLSALTGLQQDLRFSVARAARGEDQAELDRAVATAYGWPAELDAAELPGRLYELNRRRAG